MEKEQVQKVLNELKRQAKKKFLQSYDLIINLKGINVKLTPVDAFVTVPHSKGRKLKIAAFVSQELIEQANKFCDLVIKEQDFPKYADKKVAKRLAEDYDLFIAQMNLMGKIAGAFGKVLGTKGKMPNPKMGCVVPPNANLEMVVKKLNLTVHLAAKKATNLQCIVGKENQPDNEIVENVIAIYNNVLKQLPNEVQSIKNVSLKLTMGKPVRVI